MKRIFETIGCMSLIVFSFYFTNMVSLIVANKSSLMNDVKNVSSTYNIEPIDARIINDNEIIPGIGGRVVNTEESYLKMREFGKFNSLYLVFDNIKPNISLKDNMDKYIISGNKSKRSVSIIIEDDKNLINFFEYKVTPFTLIKTYNTNNNCTNCELINGEESSKLFGKLETNNICIFNYSNIELCKKNKYFIIKPSIILDNSNIYSGILNINNGSIILIKENTSIDNVNYLLNYLYSKDLTVEYITKLIEE